MPILLRSIIHLLTAYCLLSLFLFTSCKSDGISTEQIDQLPAISGDKINIVVEIPAGTNHKIEYRLDQSTFVNDTSRGKKRVIDFLPYPGNYGFIPGTMMDEKRGGDGDPLDVLLLCESLPTGTVVTSQPLGTLLLRDRGDIDTKIIAIPADPAKRIIEAENFVDFLLYYDPAKRIIEQWFANYKGPEKVEVIRWEDDVYAWREVNRWLEEKD